MSQTIRRALLSVSNKEGLLEFARALREQDVLLLSTGGTARLLRDDGIEVTDVSEITAFPEIMGGRVKTLHPRIHGGLLGRRSVDDEVMREHGIEPIDLVAVNLYPFAETVHVSEFVGMAKRSVRTYSTHRAPKTGGRLAG